MALAAGDLARRLTARLGAARDRARRAVFALVERGETVVCDLCGWRGRRFRVDRCPVCDSLPRHRLIPFAFRHFGVEVSNRRLLHLGPNRPEMQGVSSLGRPAAYLALDLVARPFVTLRADATRLPIATASLDVFLAWHVLEHIPDDRGVMAEVHRALRPGGAAVISVPIHPRGNPTTQEDPALPRVRFAEVHGHEDHVRSCGLDYARRFETLGFRVEELSVGAVAAQTSGEVSRLGLSQNHVAWCLRT